MKVLLISVNREQINMRTLPWGLGCVAASAARAGHDVSMLDLMTAEDPGETVAGALSSFGPDVIGLSVRNIDDQNRLRPTFFLSRVKDVVDRCRELTKAPLVLGGAGYSIFPDSALEFLGADMGIQGEGEAAFPMLLDRLERDAAVSDVPGLYVRGQGLQAGRRFQANLDALALPDPGLFRDQDPSDPDLWIPVQARRGCALACSYCSTAVIEGREVRRRSAGRVVDWVARQAEAGFGRIYFVDNNFNIPPRYPLEVCGEMVRRRLEVQWRCILNPMHADETLVAAMAAAGCTDVSLGFESGCASMLRSLNKSFTLDQVRRTGDLLAGHGIRRMGFLLLGGPGETRETVAESLAFADSLGFEAVRITQGIRIYPHTALADLARREGVVSGDDDLLLPRFYLAQGLEGWLEETLQEWQRTRPHWIV